MEPLPDTDQMIRDVCFAAACLIMAFAAGFLALIQLLP